MAGFSWGPPYWHAGVVPSFPPTPAPPRSEDDPGPASSTFGYHHPLPPVSYTPAYPMVASTPWTPAFSATPSPFYQVAATPTFSVAPAFYQAPTTTSATFPPAVYPAPTSPTFDAAYYYSGAPHPAFSKALTTIPGVGEFAPEANFAGRSAGERHLQAHFDGSQVAVLPSTLLPRGALAVSTLPGADIIAPGATEIAPAANFADRSAGERRLHARFDGPQVAVLPPTLLPRGAPAPYTTLGADVIAPGATGFAPTANFADRSAGERRLHARFDGSQVAVLPSTLLPRGAPAPYTTLGADVIAPGATGFAPTANFADRSAGERRLHARFDGSQVAVLPSTLLPRGAPAPYTTLGADVIAPGAIAFDPGVTEIAPAANFADRSDGERHLHAHFDGSQVAVLPSSLLPRGAPVAHATLDADFIVPGTVAFDPGSAEIASTANFAGRSPGERHLQARPDGSQVAVPPSSLLPGVAPVAHTTLGADVSAPRAVAFDSQITEIAASASFAGHSAGERHPHARFDGSQVAVLPSSLAPSGAPIARTTLGADVTEPRAVACNPDSAKFADGRNASELPRQAHSNSNNDSNGEPPSKTFQPTRFGRLFKGTPENEGFPARRFISKVEMLRRATPNVTDAQLITIAVANLGADAQRWFFAEDSNFFKDSGGTHFTDDFNAFKQRFLQRFGTIDPSRNYLKLRNMKIGNSESLLNFAQRLRDRIFAANVVDENTKITIFINALEEPLKSQLNTRLPATFDQAVDDADFLSRRIRPATSANLSTTSSPPIVDAGPLASTSTTPFRDERSKWGIVPYSCMSPGSPPWRATAPSTAAAIRAPASE